MHVEKMRKGKRAAPFTLPLEVIFIHLMMSTMYLYYDRFHFSLLIAHVFTKRPCYLHFEYFVDMMARKATGGSIILEGGSGLSKDAYNGGGTTTTMV